MGARKFATNFPQPYLALKNYCVGEAPSGSTFLIVPPSQTAARIEAFRIAVLPQAEHFHRNVNGDAAVVQSQLASGWFIGAVLLVVLIALNRRGAVDV